MIDMIVGGACVIAAGVSACCWRRCKRRLGAQRELMDAAQKTADRLRKSLSDALSENISLSSHLEDSADKLSAAYTKLKEIQKMLEEESAKSAQYIELADASRQAELKACTECDEMRKKIDEYRIGFEKYSKINCELNEEMKILTDQCNEFKKQLEYHRKLVTAPLYAEQSKGFLEGLEAVLAYNLDIAQKAGGIK